MFGEKIEKDGFTIEKGVDYYRIILMSRNLFGDNALRYKPAATGVKLLIGKVSGIGEDVIQKIIFDPEKFTMQEALEWAAKNIILK